MNLNLAIDPVAFEVFGIPIMWYAIFITSGMVLSLVLGSLEAKRRGVSTDFVLEIFMWCVPIAVIFARIVYVLAHPASYFPINNREDFFEIFRIDHGGLTIIGGILGAVLGAIIVSKIRKKNLLEMMDFGMPFMLLGQAIGRWGNYVNQEAYGRVVQSEFFERFPLGVFIDRTNQWHYGTFFYEMVLNIIGFAVLYTIGRKTNKRGVVAIGYFVWYGIVRGFLEFIREDAVIVNGVYITQVGSFAAATIGIVIIILILRGKLSLGTSRFLLDDVVVISTPAEEELVRKEFIATKENAEPVADKPIEDEAQKQAEEQLKTKPNTNQPEAKLSNDLNHLDKPKTDKPKTDKPKTVKKPLSKKE